MSDFDICARCQRCGDEMYSYAVSEREAKHVQRMSREVLADEYCEGRQR